MGVQVFLANSLGTPPLMSTSLTPSLDIRDGLLDAYEDVLTSSVRSALEASNEKTSSEPGYAAAHGPPSASKASVSDAAA